LRSIAIATPKIVNGIPRSRNIRNSRQTPEREPYS